jgi:hypothetical protein
MNIKEFTKSRLQKSADASKVFWGSVKKRFRPSLAESEDRLELIDIQELDDDCVDLVFLRKSDVIDLEQLEICRIQAERRFLRKPKIRIDFISGPFKEDFFDKTDKDTHNKKNQAGMASPPLL